MRFALLAGLASLASSVSATALTYRLEANEKACFYTNVEQANAKVAFYFAVRLLLLWHFAPQHVSQLTITIDKYWRLFWNRFNLVAPSMLTTPWLHQAARSSWMVQRNDRVTTSLLPRATANTLSASTMKCQLLPRRWLTSRLLYVTPAETQNKQPHPGHPHLQPSLAQYLQPANIVPLGWERIPRPASFPPGCHPWANLLPRRIHL